MEDFFGLGPEVKRGCVDSMPSFLGYSSKPEFDKEFFHVRATKRDAFWPRDAAGASGGAQFRAHSEEMFEVLHETAQALLGVLFAAVGVAQTDAAALFESVDTLDGLQMSASNLNLFRCISCGTVPCGAALLRRRGSVAPPRLHHVA